MNPDNEQSPEAKALARAKKGLMNIEAQEIFDNIIELNPYELTAEDRAFLYSRRGYLNDRQLENFKEVLDSQEKLAEQKLIDEGVLEKKETKVIEDATDSDMELAESLKDKKK